MNHPNYKIIQLKTAFLVKPHQKTPLIISRDRPS